MPVTYRHPCLSGRSRGLRAFFTAYLHQRMALLWPNTEVLHAVLPEMLVNEELSKLYYQRVAMRYQVFFQAMAGQLDGSLDYGNADAVYLRLRSRFLTRMMTSRIDYSRVAWLFCR